MAVKLEAPVKPAELIEDYRHGFHDPENYVFKSDKGLTREIVERISAMKDEPDWMREFRLKAYELFLSKPMPTWGDTARLKRDRLRQHPLLREVDRPDGALVGRRPRRHQADVRSPWASRRPSASFSSGVSAQYESEVVYHNTTKALDEQGVLFCDMDTAVKKYPEIVRSILRP